MKLAIQFRTVIHAVSVLALIITVSGCQPAASNKEASPITPSFVPRPTFTSIMPTWTAIPVTVAIPTSTVTPEKREIGYPSDTRTGISHLDAIIDAMLANDHDRILNLIHFAQVGCTTELGFGGPPKCRSGEAPGTLVEGVPTLGVSEGMGLRRDELDPSCSSCRLVAALSNVVESIRSEGWEFPAKYALVFGTMIGPGCCTILLVDDKGIVAFILQPLDRVGQIVSGDFILPPVRP